MSFFGFKKQQEKQAQPVEALPKVSEQMTDEGISQEAVNKSEAFVNPLASEAAAKEVGAVVIKAEQAGASAPENVIELPAPEIPNPEDPQPGSDHQLTA